MEYLKYEKEGSFFSEEKNIGVIRLNKPESLNSLSAGLLEELDKLLDEIEADPEVRVVVITAEGQKIFSAGADLKVASKIETEQEVRALIEKGQAVYRKLENLSCPTICGINALCLGGGLEMALACDIRIAAEEAKLGSPEVSIGLIPAWGGTQRLPRILGKGRAMELALTGGMVSAKEALDMGLINKVVPFDELESTINFTAAKIAGNAPIAVKLAKKCVNASFTISIEEGNKKETDAGVACFKTQDIREGIQAVFEKRKGDFKGK
jgi:enoyl-CoA hydratase